jgi:hypothetical protein
VKRDTPIVIYPVEPNRLIVEVETQQVGSQPPHRLRTQRHLGTEENTRRVAPKHPLALPPSLFQSHTKPSVSPEHHRAPRWMGGPAPSFRRPLQDSHSQILFPLRSPVSPSCR